MTEPTREYQALMEVIVNRSSCHRWKPDPVAPEDVRRIMEAGRWAMSGANSQPWEFIVVTDQSTRKKLYQAYRETNVEYLFWMEQQRQPELRHRGYQFTGTLSEQLEQLDKRIGWDEAPVLICIVGDGRKQWGTVMGAMAPGRHMTHLTDGLANACQNMHLAAFALGLGAEWVTIHLQEPFKRILEIPDLLLLHSIVAVGYPAGPRRPHFRRQLDDLVHYEKYEQSKYLSNASAVEYVRNIRKQSAGERPPAPSDR